MANVPLSNTLEQENISNVQFHESSSNEKHQISKSTFDINSSQNDTSEVEENNSCDSDTSGVYFASSSDKTSQALSGNESEESIRFGEGSFEDDDDQRSPYYLRSSRSRSSSPVDLAGSSNENALEEADAKKKLKAKKLRRQTITPAEAKLLLPECKIDRKQALLLKYDRYKLPTLDEIEEDTTVNENKCNLVQNNMDLVNIEPLCNDATEVKSKRNSMDGFVFNINVHIPKEYGEKDIPLNVNIIKDSSSKASIDNESNRERKSTSLNTVDTTFESNTSSVSYRDSVTSFISDEGVNEYNMRNKDKNHETRNENPGCSSKNVENDWDWINMPSTSKGHVSQNTNLSKSHSAAEPIKNNDLPMDDDLPKVETPNPSVLLTEPKAVENEENKNLVEEKIEDVNKGNKQIGNAKQKKASAGKEKRKYQRKQPTEQAKNVVPRSRAKNTNNHNQQNVNKKKENNEGCRRKDKKKKKLHHKKSTTSRHHCHCSNSSDSSDSSSSCCDCCACCCSYTSSECCCSSSTCSSSYSSSSSD